MMNRQTEQWSALPAQQAQQGVTVRPIQPNDAALIHEMHQRLSADSIYYRYLQPRMPSMAELEQICHLDPAKGAGFVATAQSDTEMIVGVAYYVREMQSLPPIAEPGILVEDHFQGQGIGRNLWQRMQQHALVNTVHKLRVLFHPNNQRVARLVRGGGFAYQAARGGGLSEYLVALGERPHSLPMGASLT